MIGRGNGRDQFGAANTLLGKVAASHTHGYFAKIDFSLASRIVKRSQFANGCTVDRAKSLGSWLQRDGRFG
jgi:hypothetical protein